jgi:putative ABC transport system permease protein
MDVLAHDLRSAARTLLQMRGVAVVAILTLAVGVGATTTMFSVVYAMLLRQPPFPGAERLVILFNTSARARGSGNGAGRCPTSASSSAWPRPSTVSDRSAGRS